jgi:hypothetical protein
MFEMSALGSHTRSESGTPLVDCSVDNGLLHAVPHLDQALSQFFIADLGLIDPLLHSGPHFVIHQIQVWIVWWPIIRQIKKSGVSLRNSSIVSNWHGVPGRYLALKLYRLLLNNKCLH